MSDAEYVTSDSISIVAEAQDETGFVFEDGDRNRKLSVSDVGMIEILDFASDPVSEAEMLDFMAEEFGFDADSARRTLEELESHGLVVNADDDTGVGEESEKWERRNWSEAFEYYRYIRSYPYLDYSEGKEAFSKDHNLMMEYKEEEPIPPIYKEYDDAEVVDLPEPETDADLPEIRDVLDFTTGALEGADGSIDRLDLSSVMHYVFGEIGRVQFPEQGECLRKTSPSGGARHPTEAYVAVFDVDDVPPGLYHYSVKDHALEVLNDADPADYVTDSIYELRGRSFEDLSFLVVFTSVLERSMWRYREPRTYTVVMNDVGHLLETFRMVTRAYGLDATFGHGYDDEKLSALLGLDCFDEPIFRYATVRS